MPRVTLALGSQRDRTAPGAHTARLINLYSEGNGAGGTADAVLRPAYGMVAHSQLDGVFLRGLAEVGAGLYALMDGSLWLIESGGATRLATTATGEVGGLSPNLGQIAGCLGGSYFVWSGSALLTPSTGAVTSVAWVEYLAGRTIIGQTDSGLFGWSDISDPTTFGGLNIATAEARDDNTLRGIVSGDVLHLMGEKTTELWVPAGAGANAFAPAGVVLDRGLLAPGLVCRAAGGLFFVGDDRVCYVLSGNDLVPVSPPWVIAAIAADTPSSVLFWEERGHKFAAVTWNNRPAAVFDLSTKEWWERAEGVDRLAWRARAAGRVAGEWVVISNGGVVAALRDVRSDLGGVQSREAVSAPLAPGRRFTVPLVEIRLGAGYERGLIGLQIGNGELFGPLQVQPTPALGHFGGVVKYRALGQHEMACLRVVQTDTADVPLFATAEVTVL